MKDRIIKNSFISITGVLIIIFLFLVASTVSEFYRDELLAYMDTDGALVKFLYVIFEVLAIVLVPISTTPLIPIASHAWGWIITGILSIVGWSLGAQLAFYLARAFGKPFVAKLFSTGEINIFEKHFTGKHLFWSIVFFRMIAPVDILSYAIGLFSKMTHVEYFWATLIGITPFAFLFSYTGSLSLQSQLIIFFIVSLVIFLIYIIERYEKRKIV